MIKEIRINAMLGWVQANFPDLKIIHIVRDPYSVAISRSEKGWDKNPVRHYSKQNHFTEDNLSDGSLKVLRRCDSPFQRSITAWAIENYCVLKHVKRNGNITSVFYETLAYNANQEIKRLAGFCGRQIENDLDLKQITKESGHATKDSIVDPEDKNFGRRWEGKITEADKKYADEVIEAFGLSGLYPERNKPGYDQPLDLVL